MNDNQKLLKRYPNNRFPMDSYPIFLEFYEACDKDINNAMQMIYDYLTQKSFGFSEQWCHFYGLNSYKDLLDDIDYGDDVNIAAAYYRECKATDCAENDIDLYCHNVYTGEKQNEAVFVKELSAAIKSRDVNLQTLDNLTEKYMKLESPE
jgi:hypothetical protein